MLLVSPSLEILLLHRVQTSSSFPSAHVFPGGNIDKQDGPMPEEGIERHKDNQAYRVGALRELFEESGILLARQLAEPFKLISIAQTTREKGRKLVHSDKMLFQAWLDQQSSNAVLDTDGLIPFSHWITPPTIPRRFTTQMYIYFLPSEDSKPIPSAAQPLPKGTGAPALDPKQETADFTPTPDGNIENTAATFLPAQTWLDLAQRGSIILFPPQFLLLHLISQLLDNDTISPPQRIQQLRDFIYRTPEDGSSPPWSEKCISPYALPMPRPRGDGKVALGLDKPGPEVASSGLQGDKERVVLVKWSKEGPRELEVRMRSEVVAESRSSDTRTMERGANL